MKERSSSAVIAGLIGAVLGAAVSLAGVKYTIDGQLRQQRLVFEEEHTAEQRRIRATTYEDFLDAADAFANASVDVASTLNCNTRTCAVTPESRTKGEWARYQTARFNYQGEINAVYVYGSDAAVEKSRAVSGSLPRALVSATEEQTEIDQVDSVAFRTAYQDFLSLVCHEIPPRPRRRC